MADPVGIAVDPSVPNPDEEGQLLGRYARLYVVLDNGEVYERSVGEGAKWRLLDEVPNTPAAERDG